MFALVAFAMAAYGIATATAVYLVRWDKAPRRGGAA
jgi:hypothetical protein